MTKITKRKFLKALKNSAGNQSRVADRLEVSRSAVGKYIQRNPDMKEAFEDEAERYIDVAEDNITTNIIVHGDVPDSFKMLTNSKRGKARGWGAKTEIEHTLDQTITFQEVIMTNEQIKKMKNDKKNNTEPKTTGNP